MKDIPGRIQQQSSSQSVCGWYNTLLLLPLAFITQTQQSLSDQYCRAFNWRNPWLVCLVSNSKSFFLQWKRFKSFSHLVCFFHYTLVHLVVSILLLTHNLTVSKACFYWASLGAVYASNSWPLAIIWTVYRTLTTPQCCYSTYNDSFCFRGEKLDSWIFGESNKTNSVPLLGATLTQICTSTVLCAVPGSGPYYEWDSTSSSRQMTRQHDTDRSGEAV